MNLLDAELFGETAKLFKGSNMIVCVLLVSNSRGCHLAAPGDHEGAALGDRPAARQHLREFDTNNTHTIMFDPDYNIMPPFFPQQPIFCSLKVI